jgi:hypothetical protein
MGGQKFLDELNREYPNVHDFSRQYQFVRNAAVKKHYSSTHNWIRDTEHWSNDNLHWYSFECRDCGLVATKYDECYGECTETLDFPSRDMHNVYISRTCEQICLDKKNHKKRKCMTCRTYGCPLHD